MNREEWAKTPFGEGWCAGMREAFRFWAPMSLITTLLAFAAGLAIGLAW